jgi:hypothetical protein
MLPNSIYRIKKHWKPSQTNSHAIQSTVAIDSTFMGIYIQLT